MGSGDDAEDEEDNSNSEEDDEGEGEEDDRDDDPDLDEIAANEDEMEAVEMRAQRRSLRKERARRKRRATNEERRYKLDFFDLLDEVEAYILCVLIRQPDNTAFPSGPVPPRKVSQNEQEAFSRGHFLEGTT